MPEKNLKTFSDAFKKIFYILGPEKKRLPFLYGLFLASSMIDFCGIGLVGPFIGMITYPQEILDKYPVVGSIFRNFSHEEMVVTLGLMLIVAFAMKGVAFYVVQKLMIGFSFKCRIAVISRLLSSYQQLPYHLLSQKNSSTMIVNLNTHSTLFSDAILIQIMRGSVEIFVLIALLLLLAWVSIWSVIIPGIYFIIIMTGWDRFIKNRLYQYGQRSSKAESGLIGSVNHAIGALKEIRLLNREGYFHDASVAFARENAEANTRSRVLQGLQRYLFETSIVVLVVGAIIFLISRGGDPVTAFAMLGVFGVASIRLLPSVSQIGFAFMTVRNYLYAVEALYTDLHRFEDSPLKDAPKSGHTHLQAKVRDFGAIACRDMSYTYPGTSTGVLDAINLEIKSGDTIGIIGKSGSGKTTLIDVILGLLTPTDGGVYLDGRNISDREQKGLLDAWQSNIIYIPQDMFLTDDTIRHNIAFGCPDSEIDEDRLRDAIQQAELVELVEQSPAGLDTVIGERGAKLSGGQRQRIGIARAFYFGREVVVMDEATSALDNETEAEILKFINTFRDKRTLIIIAHRLSTIKTCDHIFKLDQGRIVSEGNYDKVVNNSTDEQ